MADDAEFEKICPECQAKNLVNAVKCEQCDTRLKYIEPTKKTTSSQGESPADEPQPLKCPKCGAVVSDGQPCRRCKHSEAKGMVLSWHDDRLAELVIATGKSVFIGRVPPADEGLIVTLEQFYPSVSRMHAELQVDTSGSIWLRDLGSRNGTWVNEQKVTVFCPLCLKQGDEIRFAGSLKGYLKLK